MERWRFTVFCPSNRDDTTVTLKCVSPLAPADMRDPACPACWLDSSTIDSLHRHFALMNQSHVAQAMHVHAKQRHRSAGHGMGWDGHRNELRMESGKRLRDFLDGGNM